MIGKDDFKFKNAYIEKQPNHYYLIVEVYKKDEDIKLSTLSDGLFNHPKIKDVLKPTFNGKIDLIMSGVHKGAKSGVSSFYLQFDYEEKVDYSNVKLNHKYVLSVYKGPFVKAKTLSAKDIAYLKGEGIHNVSVKTYGVNDSLVELTFETESKVEGNTRLTNGSGYGTLDILSVELGADKANRIQTSDLIKIN